MAREAVPEFIRRVPAADNSGRSTPEVVTALEEIERANNEMAASSDPFAPPAMRQSRREIAGLTAIAGALTPKEPDPIIKGLLSYLPQPGDVWPDTKRKLWLSVVENSFKLIYKEAAEPAE